MFANKIFNRNITLAIGLAIGVMFSSGAAADTATSLHFLPIPDVSGETVKVDNAGDYTIKFGFGLSKTSAQYRGAEYFKKYVEKRSDGHIKVNLYPNGQLGDDLEMTGELQSGTLQMTQPSTSPLIHMFPQLAVFDLPFLFKDAEQAHHVINGPVGDTLLKEINQSHKGVIALGWAQNGFRQLSDNAGVVSSPSDLKGLKIRTMQSPVQLDIWKHLGANPTPMSFSELFTALDQGTVDAQENPWVTILTSKLYEVETNATDTRHVYTPFITLMSARFWQRLPEPYQELVREASKKMGDYERKVAMDINDQAKKILSKKLKITELTPEQRAAFKKKAQPVYDDYKEQIGEDLFEKVMKATSQSDKS